MYSCNCKLAKDPSQNVDVNRKERLYHITLLRVLAIFLVVLFHSLHMLMDGTHLPTSTEIYISKYHTFNGFINSFNMPLFIFVSGFLYSDLESEKGKYKSFSDLIKNKAKRLLVPFFIFMALMMITLRDFHLEPWISWSYCHLWFLPMLFWCFVFTKLQSYSPFNNNIYWILGILILSGWLTFYDPDIQNIIGLKSFLRWYFWFYLGYQISKVRIMLLIPISRHPIITIALLLSLFVGGIYLKLSYPGITSDIFYGIVSITSIIILLYACANVIFTHRRVNEKFFIYLNWLSKHSFGVYIFHYWIQPLLIGTTLAGIFGLDIMAYNHTVTFPVVYILISLCVSFFLSWLLLKTKIGKFLIG